MQTTGLKTIGQADRATYIGGSDAAAILGISPWKTALDVFLDKTQGIEKDDPPARPRFLPVEGAWSPTSSTY